MELHKEQLRAKGWSEEEIKHTHKILKKVKRTKHPHRHLLNDALFWALLLLSMFAAAAIAYWLIPIMTMLQASVVYPVVFIVGITFGLLFAIVIHDIEHLEKHHHLIVHLLAPIAAIISFFFVITRTNSFGGEQHSAILVGLTYTIGFLAPYTYHYLKNKK